MSITSFGRFPWSRGLMAQALDKIGAALSVLTIELPPLRNRGSDIELLALHFLRKLGGNGQPPVRLTREATDALRAYSFPVAGLTPN